MKFESWQLRRSFWFQKVLSKTFIFKELANMKLKIVRATVLKLNDKNEHWILKIRRICFKSSSISQNYSHTTMMRWKLDHQFENCPKLFEDKIPHLTTKNVAKKRSVANEPGDRWLSINVNRLYDLKFKALLIWQYNNKKM